MIPNVIADLSHHNLVNLHSLKNNGIKAIIHKATQGMASIRDPMYQSRTALARTIGLLTGSYHFGTGSGTGAEQAENYLYDIDNSIIPQHLRTSGPLVLDFETNALGPSMSIQQAVEFVQTVFDKTGRWPGFYCNQAMAKTLLSKQPKARLIVENCWLWLAWYVPGVFSPQLQVEAIDLEQWPAGLKLWQYSDGSARFHPEKYMSNIDADAFNGTLEDLQTWWASFSA